MRRIFIAGCVAFFTLVVSASPRRVALIVQNHCSGNVQPPMSALADTLTVSLTAQGLSIVNPANSIGTTKNATVVGEKMPGVAAKELGTILGVDGVITASVQDFTSESIGVPAVAYKLKTRLTLTLFDCATGGSVCGTGMQNFSKNYTVEQVKEDNATLYEGFLHASAEKCAARFLDKYAGVSWAPQPGKTVNVFFGCNVLGADIQIDGLSYGTCPTQVAVTPGVHKILVSYPPYYSDFKRDALFRTDGQTYAVVLQITPEGARLRESDLNYEKKKKDLENAQSERSELFKKQLALADAMLERYKLSGAADDYVRKTIAEGTAVYWKNSFGRIAITEGSATNLVFATPLTKGSDVSVPPSPTQIGEGLQKFLMRRTHE